MNIDDPKLTAYVLDEELDPAERAEIERLLREDPAGTAEAAEIRALATRLREELAREGPMALTEERRAGLLLEAKAAGTIRLTARRRPVWLPTALAAGLMLLLGTGYWMTLRRPPDLRRSLGMTETPREEIQSAFPAPLPASTPSPALTAAAAAKPNEHFILTEPEKADAPLATPLPAQSAPEPAVGAAPHPSAMLAASSAPVAAEAPAPPMAAASLSPNATTSPTASTASAMDSAAKRATTDPSGLASAMGRSGGMAKNKAAPSSTSIDGVGRRLRVGEDKRLAQNAPAPFYKLSRDLEVSPARQPLGGAMTTPAPEPNESGYFLRPEGDGGDRYDRLEENAFLAVSEQPLSTFSIDVDTASYTNVKRMLQMHQKPPEGAVRVEEMINYFQYDYPAAPEGQPCSVNMEVASCPWQPQHRLLRVGLKAREIPLEKRPAANLVFLFDVSGSMQPANRLPLAVQCLRLLTDQLKSDDRVAIAVYAGSSGTVLEPTSDKGKIRDALDRLQAGGSTNGAEGIQLAYQLARRSFVAGQINRVILCTDGDFNVGMTSQGDLLNLIAREAKGGVFLTILGYGYGNLKDSTLQKLADRGNGNYAYVNDLTEGRRVLVEQMSGTLLTVAKDVKLQLEFNPAQVGAYRLIGYEKRRLENRDFNDDTKDAGEMGSGQTVTALYELVPPGLPLPNNSGVDELKYAAVKPSAGAARESQTVEKSAAPVTAPAAKAVSTELLTLKLRWKSPEGDKSSVKEFPLSDAGKEWAQSSADFRWAAAVASFGMTLRDSPHRGAASWNSIRELAEEGKGSDRSGYRQEFLSLIDEAKRITSGE